MARSKQTMTRWNARLCDFVRTQLATGLSAGAVAKLATISGYGKLSKNMVVGRAHREEWPILGKPIADRGHQWTSDERNTIRENAHLSNNLLAIMLPGRTVLAIKKQRRKLGCQQKFGSSTSTDLYTAPTTLRLAIEAPPSMSVEPPIRYGREPCTWPIGTPRTRSFRYCDAPSIYGKPYCPEHAAAAYQPTRI